MRCLALFALLAACGAEPAPVVAPPPEPPPAPPAAPPASVDPCTAHQAAFRAALASASGTCTTDTECGCFNPVVGEAGCGGITDAATAARLGAIEADFHRDGCPWPHLCGPWACTPVCREGRCVNGGAGGMIWPAP